jgi:hypothetical protein
VGRKNPPPKNMASHRTTSESSRCPLIRVVGANEHGLIAISRRELEVGSNFALGLHVSLPNSRQSEFVTAETMIAACQPEVDVDGRPVFRVALLFSDISWTDRDLLELMAYDEGLLGPIREDKKSSLELSGQARLDHAINSICLN